MSAKDRKARRDARSDPYDDIDIFSGPAGQVLVDVDPNFGGIQSPEDELIGSQFTRDLGRFTKGITESLAPSDETIAAQEQQRAKNQEIFDLILKVAGLQPGSFEANQLLMDLKKNPKFQEALGFDQGNILTGGGTTDSPTYGLFDLGNLFFGDARRGLTSIVDDGVAFKDLPFEQKLGITILPIDLLDVVGITAGGALALKTLVKGGMKQYGKQSGKVVSDLLNDEALLSKIEADNPGFIKQLEELGITPDAKFASGKKPVSTGRKKGPVGTELRPRTQKDIIAERERIEAERLEREGPFEVRFDEFGAPITSKAPFSQTQGKVDDALERAAREAEALKRETDKFKQVDPSLKKAAKEADKKVEDFSKRYEAAYGSKKNRLRALEKLRKDVGAEEFDRLEKLAIEKGLSKKRNLAPQGSVKKTTPEGEKFIEENAAKLSATELKLAMTQDEATAAKFFYTDGMGNVKIPPDSFFRQYPSAQFGIIREGDVGAKGGKAKSEIAKEADQKIYDQFDIFTGAEGFNMNDPRAVREAFAKAFVSDASGSKYSGFDITSQDTNFRRALARKINDYNKSKGFGEFDKTKGFEEGRVYNRNEIQQINRYLSVGEDSLEKTSIRNKFDTYLNTNDIYNNLKNNMKKLDDSFYPVVDGEIKRDFSNKLKRYLNFIRETSAETRNPVQNSFDPFINEFGNDMLALLDPNSIEYQNFLKFSYHDKIREEVGELAKPALNKIFKAPKKRPDGSIRTEQERIDEAKNSVQIAHTFESSQVGETVGEGLTGSGMIPGSYYLDLSNYNAIKQPQLEKRARAAVDEFEATGDRSKLDQVSMELEELGAEVAVGDFVLGRHKTLAEKITDIIGGPPGSKQRELLKKQYGVTDEEIAQLEQAIDLLNEAGFRTGKKTAMKRGGLITDDINIFDNEEQGTIFPKISIEFGDAAQGRAMAQPSLEKRLDEPVQRLSAEPLAAPQEKVFDVPPMENIFTGEVQEANLKLPFFKLFTKPPLNETAPIPTPKESLDNPTKKQKESLEQEKLNKEQDFFDPTPEDNTKVDLGSSTDVATTPKTKQPLTGVFYSDAEKVLQRPDTPAIFPNKQALIDFFAKNRIKKTELEDYGINNLLKAFDDVTPIPKEAVIRQIRSSPVRGMHVHGTGKGSEIINPSGEKVNVAYEGYRADGFIPGTTSERVLYIPIDKLPGDTAGQPRAIFQGEDIQNHGFGLPGGSDNNYVVGWTRLSERRALLPAKLDAPADRSKIPGLTRERERAQRQVAGLYAEAINKLNREGVRRGLSQGDLDELSQLSLEQIQTQYGGVLNRLSPGLLDQIDELIVKVRDLDTEITKASTVDASNVVKVLFADEIQSDIMQAAAGRKQKLLATLRKLQEEGRESTTLPDLDRVGNEALAFFEKNKSVFRPLKNLKQR